MVLKIDDKLKVHTLYNKYCTNIIDVLNFNYWWNWFFIMLKRYNNKKMVFNIDNNTNLKWNNNLYDI